MEASSNRNSVERKTGDRDEDSLDGQTEADRTRHVALGCNPSAYEEHLHRVRSEWEEVGVAVKARGS